MQTQYQVYLHRDDGQRIATIDRYFTLSFTRALNNFGAFSIDLPRSFDPSILKNDQRISIWRKPPNGAMYREFYGLIRIPQTAGVQRIHTISGYDFNYLLYTHQTEYTAGSSQAKVSATPADNAMKAIVRNEMGASATTRFSGDSGGAARALNSTYFTVEANTSLGPNISRQYAWRRVLDVLKDMANDARQAGTDIYFDMDHVDETQVIFRTYKNQRGLDRRSSSSTPILFGVDFGNLADPLLLRDATDEVNAALAMGSGTQATRNLVEVVGTNATLDLWSRAEATVNAPMDSTSAALTSAANAALIGGRIRQTFNATLINVGNTIYGRDYNFGDRVTISYDGSQFDALIRGVTVMVANGLERIVPTLETYL